MHPLLKLYALIIGLASSLFFLYFFILFMDGSHICLEESNRIIAFTEFGLCLAGVVILVRLIMERFIKLHNVTFLWNT